MAFAGASWVALKNNENQSNLDALKLFEIGYTVPYICESVWFQLTVTVTDRVIKKRSQLTISVTITK
jgi:hypothetical protein